MKLSEIVLRLRAADTVFGNRIAGAAEFTHADENAVKDGAQAFVVPVGFTVEQSDITNGVQFKLKENFNVYAVLDNSLDYTGNDANDAVDDVRAELWASLLGWVPTGFDEPVISEGGNLGPLNRSYLVYEFLFSATRSVSEAEGYQPEATDEFLTITGLDDLVTYGDFSVSDNWTLGDGWTIAAGKASCDGTQEAVSDLSQVLKLVAGHSCTVNLETSGISGGSVTPILGGTAGTAITDDGEKEQIIIAGEDDSLIVFRASADFVGSLDDVQVLTGFGIDIDDDGEAEAEFNINLRS
ncbi:MAG: hypothetical protein ABIK28_03505 [Planctomycetota bacterium]